MITNRPVFILITAFLCATTACAPVGRSIQRVGTHVHEETVALDHRVRNWFDSENQAMAAGRNVPAPTTAYCYKTLSDISCYAQPVLGQERRLVGKQVPEPMFAELNTPVPGTKPEPPMPEPATGENIVTADAQPDAAGINTGETIPDYRKPRTLIPVFEGDLY